MDNYPELKDKKLLAFDLYGTCIDHDFGDVRISRDLKEMMKNNPITLQDIQEWKVEKDWIKIQIDDELISKIVVSCFILSRFFCLYSSKEIGCVLKYFTVSLDNLKSPKICSIHVPYKSNAISFLSWYLLKSNSSFISKNLF